MPPASLEACVVHRVTLDLDPGSTGLTLSPAWKAGRGEQAPGAVERIGPWEAPTPRNPAGAFATVPILLMRNRGPRVGSGELLEPQRGRAMPGCTQGELPCPHLAAEAPAAGRPGQGLLGWGTRRALSWPRSHSQFSAFSKRTPLPKKS